MALGAGFGLDLMTCDPEVFEALCEQLEEQQRKARQEELAAKLKAMTG